MIVSRFGEIRLDWGGEPDRLFRLKIGQIGRLQEKLNAGPTGIAMRCHVTYAALAFQAQKDWVGLSSLDLTKIAEKTHIRETLLQGLLGAGMALPEAEKLIREYVDERPLAENLIPCIEVCNASVYGVEDEKPMGEPEAAAAANQSFRTENSALAKAASTPSAPPPASAPLT